VSTPSAQPAAGSDDRPTIVHVLHTLNAAGAEVLVRDLCGATGDRYRSIVIALDGEGPLRAALEARGAVVYALHRRPGLDWACARQIATIARRAGAAILHAHQYTPFFYAAIARLIGARRCRLVFTEHGRHYPDHRRWKRVLANHLLTRLTARITAVGESVAEKLARNEGMPRRRIEVIHNGVDPDRFPTLSEAQRAAARRAIGVGPGQALILQVAGFRPVKDHATAIRAFARLRRAGADAVLAFAGAGPTQAEARTLAESLGVADRVRFLGARGDVPQLWAAADAGLLTSLSEGVSVAGLEAMAAGRPMIATDVGGNAEIIADGRTGRLAPRGDDKAIAEAMQQLIEHPELRHAMGRAARQRLEARFTQTAMHEAYDRLYRSLLAAPKRPANARSDTAPDRLLIVFADDYGRHPSSAQHIIKRLPETWRILWVNTIGTRRPRLCRADARRAWGKVKQWLGVGGDAPAGTADDPPGPANLRVINPTMWPGFRTPLARCVNRSLLGRAVRRTLGEMVGPRHGGPRPPVTALTALPITAGLVGRLPVDRWVYYMVDDFAAWPGLDGEALRLMESRQLGAVDRVAAVSEPLARRAEAFGHRVERITHGVDLAHWQGADRPQPPAAGIAATLADPSTPTAVFWGLIDARLDAVALAMLCAQWAGRVLLVGPAQGDVERLAAIEGVEMPGPAPYEQLPRIAAAADVLIMPYATTAATRAMQPLKLMEYLATDRPVVCLTLPSTRAWSDAADVVTRGEFADRVRRRAAEGLPDAQRVARQRLAAESWEAKAEMMRRLLEHDAPAAPACTEAPAAPEARAA